MKNLSSLILFGIETNNLNFSGELLLDDNSGYYINYIGGNLIEKDIDDEIIIYGKMNNKDFTATALPQSKKLIQNRYIKNNILIKKLFIGAFLEDIENLKISNIYIRTSYLEYWFYDFPFDSNTFTIDKDSFKIDERIEYSDNFSLSFDYEYNSNIENNKKFVFDSSCYIKIESKDEIKLIDFEKENKKVLNLFKFLLPSKNIYIEEQFFFINNTKIDILERQFYYTKENTKLVSRLDYIITYNNISKDLVIDWFKLYDKYEIIFGYLYTIFNDEIIKVNEIKFLFYMQWLEAFCREKYPILEKDLKEFDNIVKSIKEQFNKTSKEFEFIEEQTKYGVKQNLLKQVKQLIQEIKKEGYIEISKKNKDIISSKIKDLRDELTHLEPNRKSYKNIELLYINRFIKGVIVYSIINELKIPKVALENMNFIEVFRNYNSSQKHLFKES